MGGLQPMHWVIVIVVFALLFGAKKLPDLARSLGKSLRIFKSEVKELQNDGKGTEGAPQAVEQQQVPPAAVVEAPPIETTPGHKPTA
ncbi:MULTISPECIES: Sec-independent protein translocase subunit TatA [unclassified Mycobacteroides]|uniref:Sec-independent protein translocase subunit TatA n=1 Tax=unclassified Mycobacteroides TaxID=2618759 RepID=UPI0012DBF9CD|nr:MULTISPECIES: Sec-independent protein translocase subunit TatA [unclassified Mycobacteroides]MUM18772.1 preprotein translocase subunit TatA [Mycobacteroides sp. CBMA 326]